LPIESNGSVRIAANAGGAVQAKARSAELAGLQSAEPLYSGKNCWV